MKSLPLVVQVHATSEWAEDCRFVQFSLNDELVTLLKKCELVCKSNGLLEVVAAWYDIDWHNSEELQIRGEGLTVSANEHHANWWFSGYPKHSDYRFETSVLELDKLLAAYDSWVATAEVVCPDEYWHFEDGMLFIASSFAAELADEYRECLAEAGSQGEDQS